MNSGLNWLVAVFMAVALSACATGGSSPADTAAGQPAGAQETSKPAIINEPGCD